MTYQETVERIGALHGALGGNVHHYFRPQLKAPYIIWQEDGSGQFDASDRVAEMTVSGSTDFFTKKEYDRTADRIMDMFEKNGFLWKLNSIQYEQETGLIHYEFLWEMY